MEPEAPESQNGRTHPRMMAEPLDLTTVYRPLDPADLRFRENDKSELLLEQIGEGTVTPVRLERCFPLTGKEKHIIVRDDNGDELGIIADIEELEGESLKVVRDRLSEIYFMPRITRVNDIHREFSIPVWKVETDRGPRTFELRSNFDARFVGPNQIYIKDSDGLEYEIPDYTKLDRESRILIERYV